MVPTSQYGWARRGFAIPPGMGALGDERVITNAIGSGLLSSAGIIAMVPGGQLPAAIIGAVGALTGLIGGLFKPDLTKIEATHIVDQIETQLNQLEANWQALPADQKTPTNQAAFLELIDAALNKVQQGCSNPALGTAGQHCISERLIHGGAAPWCPNPGHTGCDWITAYRDPIANDPAVAANVTAAQAAAQNPATQQFTDTSTPGSAGGSNSTLSASVTAPSKAFLWGGLALLAFALGYVFTEAE